MAQDSSPDASTLNALTSQLQTRAYSTLDSIQVCFYNQEKALYQLYDYSYLLPESTLDSLVQVLDNDRAYCSVLYVQEMNIIQTLGSGATLDYETILSLTQSQNYIESSLATLQNKIKTEYQSIIETAIAERDQHVQIDYYVLDSCMIEINLMYTTLTEYEELPSRDSYIEQLDTLSDHINSYYNNLWTLSSSGSLEDLNTFDSTLDLLRQSIIDLQIKITTAIDNIGNEAAWVDDLDWQALEALYSQLLAQGVKLPWDLSAGKEIATTLSGVTIENQHVVSLDLSNRGITGVFPSAVAAFTNLSSLNLAHNKLSGDLPMALAAIAPNASEFLSSITELNISNNQYSGNVGILAHYLPNLQTLNASFNSFEEVYPTISSSVTSLNLNGQTMNRVVELNLSTLSIEDLPNVVPSLLLYDHQNQTYRTSVRLYCTAVNLTQASAYDNENWGMQLYIYDGNILVPFVSAKNDYHGLSGDTLNVLHLTESGTYTQNSFRIALKFDQGDANFFNGMDATDIQSTVLYAFGEYKKLPFNFTAADTYQDGVINVQDVICTANILLSQLSSDEADAMEPVKKFKPSAHPESTDATSAAIYLSEGNVVLHSETAVAALAVHATTGIEWDLAALGLTQLVSKGNMVAYSLNNTTLPVGDVVIGHYTSPSVRLYSASLSDADAGAISVVVGTSNTTSIQNIRTSNNDKVETYNLYGIRTTGSTSGIQIRRQAGSSQILYQQK